MKPARPQHQPIALHLVDIPVPCTASWEEMTGDVRVRHCEGCNKNVVNLSAMTAVEGAALIAENLNGELCVRMDKRHDGSVVSSDSGGPVRATARQPWRRLPGLAGAAVLALSAAGCSTGDAQPVPSTAASATVNPEPPTTVLMGAPPASDPPPAVVAPAISPVKGARQCEKDAQLQQLIGKPVTGHAMPSVLIDSKGMCTR
ncbi:hypothetical protein F2P45_31300 [Massilia sp. CCM 8733]|uniref:Uncharacterized protein n=1 Tax=Massilia mucilaginosa TaxID=2609282 RepID=A0ABX0P2H6_9BURK|nr:hypothetical protein [Massilia mucilaginosa]NHZ93457.1 hypothetical protein [Massilia mucilaginosa]